MGNKLQYVGLAVLAAAVVGVAVVALTPPPQSALAGTVPTVAATEAAAAPSFTMPPPGSDVLIIGDSWSTGYSAAEGNGYVDKLWQATDWAVTVDAQSGTGYVAVLAGGSPFTDRAAAAGGNPAAVIVQGGLNDTGQDIATVRAAADTTIATLQAKFPHAQLVLVGPSTSSWPVKDTNRAVDAQLSAAAKAAGVAYVSPLAEHWVTEQNFGQFIDPGTFHPTDYGHNEYATRLHQALTALAP